MSGRRVAVPIADTLPRPLARTRGAWLPTESRRVRLPVEQSVQYCRTTVALDARPGGPMAPKEDPSHDKITYI